MRSTRAYNCLCYLLMWRIILMCFLPLPHHTLTYIWRDDKQNEIFSQEKTKTKQKEGCYSVVASFFVDVVSEFIRIKYILKRYKKKYIMNKTGFVPFCWPTLQLFYKCVTIHIIQYHPYEITAAVLRVI